MLAFIPHPLSTCLHELVACLKRTLCCLPLTGYLWSFGLLFVERMHGYEIVDLFRAFSLDFQLPPPLYCNLWMESWMSLHLQDAWNLFDPKGTGQITCLWRCLTGFGSVGRNNGDAKGAATAAATRILHKSSNSDKDGRSNQHQIIDNAFDGGKFHRFPNWVDPSQWQW